MFDTLLGDGIVSGASDKVAAFVVKCLAVAGGFLVGYFLGGTIAWALDRWVLAQKTPAPVKKLISWAAAIALALLVALIVFGDGGNGLFGRGGGTGDGKGTPTQDDGKGKAPDATPEKKKDDTPPKNDDVKPPTPKPTPGDMHIVILAGKDVKDDKDGKALLYQIGDDPTPVTFEGLKEAVNTRRKMKGPELKSVYYRFKNEPLSTQQTAVNQVYLWLSDLKIGFVPE